MHGRAAGAASAAAAAAPGAAGALRLPPGSAHTVAERLNKRWREGSPSNDPDSAGVVITQYDSSSSDEQAVAARMASGATAMQTGAPR